MVQQQWQHNGSSSNGNGSSTGDRFVEGFVFFCNRKTEEVRANGLP